MPPPSPGELVDRLASVPPPGDRRLAVRVTPDAARQLRGGHPWLFESSITSLGHEGAPGDLAVVFDDRRRFLAIGLYDPASPIRVRLLHRGGPMPIDDGFWAARVDAALDRRRPLTGSSDTTGYRCLHGENDGLPGLVLDRYDTTLVVKLYSTAWLPHLAGVLRPVADRLHAERVVLRLSRSLRDQPRFGLDDGATLLGAPPTGPIRFRENGLVLEADVVHGQKTGHFLDQRENRQRVRSMAAGARVLDVFACTGGFSLHAAAGGAASVHRVDQSPGALATARRNVALNADLPAVRACRHDETAGDAFEVLDRLARRKRRFDLVVIDPPSFAQRRASRPGALRAYGRLVEAGLAVLEPGGVLVQASCSARVGADELFALVHERAARCGVRLDELARTGHPLDHPIGFPQGAYLKALFARRG